MKTQDQLRLMAEDWHSRIGYNQSSAALSKAADEFDAMQTQLAASQAQIKVLRDALYDQLNDCINFNGGKLTTCIMEQSTKVLEQPADDSALRELLKAERERCAKVVETAEVPIDIDIWCGTKKALTAATAIGLATKIRAMEDK